jgi:hypothetical protein
VDKASSYGLLLDAANSNTAKGFFTAWPEAIEKKLRSRGGFQSPFPLTHMNRHNNKHAEKTKTETKP